MINEILKIEPKNTNVIIGIDQKYHTVYLIEFESGDFYIGKHTTSNPIKDTYFASGRLPNLLKDKGLSYNRTITHYLPSSKEALEVETKILESKIFKMRECLNCYPGSPSSNYGTITIKKGSKFKMVNKKLLESFLQDGWETGVPKRRHIFLGAAQKFVLGDDLQKYFDAGWSLGNPKARDRVFIRKDNELKLIKRNFLKHFEIKGWVKTHNQTGYKVFKLPNGKLVKYKNLNDVPSGASPSSTVDGLLYIKCNNSYKRVHPSDIQKYIDGGWVRGNNTSGKVYITDGTSETRVNKDDLFLYPSFKVGRLKKVYLNDGDVEKRVSELDKPMIHKLLECGFVFGKLQRPKKMIIYKNRFKKFIYPSDLSEFKKLGWTEVFDSTKHFHPRL
jgi:hypothetical protein